MMSLDPVYCHKNIQSITLTCKIVIPIKWILTFHHNWSFLEAILTKLYSLDKQTISHFWLSCKTEFSFFTQLAKENLLWLSWLTRLVLDWTGSKIIIGSGIPFFDQTVIEQSYLIFLIFGEKYIFGEKFTKYLLIWPILGIAGTNFK